MDPIHIVCASNDKYAPHLAVMLTSLLMNSRSPERLHIHVIDGGGLSQAHKRKLINIAERWGGKLGFIELNQDVYSRFFVKRHISVEAYYRISIPELLDSSVKRAIYLDCDLIVQADIAGLWVTNLKGNAVGAVTDAIVDPIMKLENGYFNSGVLLIDVEKWRKQHISTRLIEYIEEHRETMFFHDQEALNAVLHHDWLPLDRLWNTFPRDGARMDGKPYILHYVSHQKPWNSKIPRRLDYAKYRQHTPWSTSKPRATPIPVALRASGSSYFMNVSQGGGAVQAKSKQKGKETLFWLYYEDPVHDIVSIKTSDQRFYLTAEGGGGGLVVANRKKLGPWELFKLEHTVQDRIALRACNGQFVCMEQFGNRQVTANRSKRGDWETFYYDMYR